MDLKALLANIRQTDEYLHGEIRDIVSEFDFTNWGEMEVPTINIIEKFFYSEISWIGYMFHFLTFTDQPSVQNIKALRSNIIDQFWEHKISRISNTFTLNFTSLSDEQKYLLGEWTGILDQISDAIKEGNVSSSCKVVNTAMEYQNTSLKQWCQKVSVPMQW